MIFLSNALALFVEPAPIDIEAMTRRMAPHWRHVVDTIALRTGHGRWAAAQDLIGADVQPYHAELADPEWRDAIIEGSVSRITDRMAVAYTDADDLTRRGREAALSLADPSCVGIVRLKAQLTMTVGPAGAAALVDKLDVIDLDRADDDDGYGLALLRATLLFVQHSNTEH